MLGAARDFGEWTRTWTLLGSSLCRARRCGALGRSRLCGQPAGDEYEQSYRTMHVSILGEDVGCGCERLSFRAKTSPLGSLERQSLVPYTWSERAAVNLLSPTGASTEKRHPRDAGAVFRYGHSVELRSNTAPSTHARRT